MDTATASAWIDLVVARSLELRKAGITSVGYAGSTATFAVLEVEAVDDGQPMVPEDQSASNVWEDAQAYPSGVVPTLGDIDAPEDFPDIPEFGAR